MKNNICKDCGCKIEYDYNAGDIQIYKCECGEWIVGIKKLPTLKNVKN